TGCNRAEGGCRSRGVFGAATVLPLEPEDVVAATLVKVVEVPRPLEEGGVGAFRGQSLLGSTLVPPVRRFNKDGEVEVAGYVKLSLVGGLGVVVARNRQEPQIGHVNSPTSRSG